MKLTIETFCQLETTEQIRAPLACISRHHHKLALRYLLVGNYEWANTTGIDKILRSIRPFGLLNGSYRVLNK